MPAPREVLLSDIAETVVVMPVYNEAAIDKADAIRVTHPINLGQGGALQTGFDAALPFTNAKYVATFDADGQHQVADLLTMIETIKQGYDVILGSRFLDQKTEMSPLRKLILKTATQVLNHRGDVQLTDAHNGLRLVTREVAGRIKLAQIGMAHASELEQVLTQSHLRVTECPVHVLYTEYSKSKGQPLLNSVNILVDILFHRVST